MMRRLDQRKEWLLAPETGLILWAFLAVAVGLFVIGVLL